MSFEKVGEGQAVAVRAGDALPVARQRRFLVFGSAMSGAEHFAQDGQKHLLDHGLDQLKMVWSSNVLFLDQALSGKYKDKPDIDLGLPAVVVAFPAMRYNDGGGGSTVPTPIEEIREFCAANNVPLVELDGYERTEGLNQGFEALVTFTQSGEPDLPPLAP